MLQGPEPRPSSVSVFESPKMSPRDPSGRTGLGALLTHVLTPRHVVFTASVNRWFMLKVGNPQGKLEVSVVSHVYGPVMVAVRALRLYFHTSTV